MGRHESFWWTIVFTLNVVIGILCLPIVPEYAMGSSSVMHAFLLMAGIGNGSWAGIILIYEIAWMIYLLCCCIFSFKGAVMPTVVALSMDLAVSFICILFEAVYAVNVSKWWPPHYWGEIIGFVFRLLYLIVVVLDFKIKTNEVYNA